jgi:hypothetical protein
MGRIFRHSASQPIVARNNLVREFLEEDDAEWLWMVDADMVFDKGHVMKLWETAQDNNVTMCTGLAMIWKEGRIPVPSLFYWNTETKQIGNVPNLLPPSGQHIAACGLASVLVHRDVFLEMKGTGRHPDYDWFDFYTNDELGINGDEMTGSDVQFFVRAARLGHKLVVETHAETWHIEEQYISHETWENHWNAS